MLFLSLPLFLSPSLVSPSSSLHYTSLLIFSISLLLLRTFLLPNPPPLTSHSFSNHDEEAEAGIDVGGFLSFKTRFGGMPYWYPQNSDSGALFYSYNIGGLHMITLSAYNDLSALSPQTVFLKQDLAAIDRTVTPWVACVWHPPIYNSNTNHYKQHEAFRKAYEPLFLEYRVNMIFNGHVHAYRK